MGKGWVGLGGDDDAQKRLPLHPQTIAAACRDLGVFGQHRRAIVAVACPGFVKSQSFSRSFSLETLCLERMKKGTQGSVGCCRNRQKGGIGTARGWTAQHVFPSYLKYPPARFL